MEKLEEKYIKHKKKHSKIVPWVGITIVDCLVQGSNSWISRKPIREGASSLFGRGPESPKIVSCFRGTPRQLAPSLPDSGRNPGIPALCQAIGIPSRGRVITLLNINAAVCLIPGSHARTESCGSIGSTGARSSQVWKQHPMRLLRNLNPGFKL